MRILIGLTGASGIIYGVRLLELLAKMNEIETYLIVSEAAREILRYETQYVLKDLYPLATHSYDIQDFNAPISSGSYLIDSMVIVPCTMKTVAVIVSGFSDNLMLRAADVTLKEKRKLIIVPRETPLSTVHLRNLYYLAKMGVHVIPAIPAFYYNPKTIDNLIDYVLGKILDALHLKQDLYQRWN